MIECDYVFLVVRLGVHFFANFRGTLNSGLGDEYTEVAFVQKAVQAG